MKMPKFKFSLTQYKRVWRLLRKPSREEFLTISKVSAIGLLIIGAIGFVIAMAMGMFSIF
ncbi:protein translocase SEC61 complex subunit gamma [Candidatus Pacearchaeota archaeon]|nr:protein translocase SEC61 complex subunit gamma [Candidatus Pacearchaeota archaeon]|tara:strand:- start:2633 stop:2812 length:180 start_codon:yes stop_codon:yes gene_type:complete